MDKVTIKTLKIIGIIIIIGLLFFYLYANLTKNSSVVVDEEVNNIIEEEYFKNEIITVKDYCSSDCKDCSLFPISKSNPLEYNYKPELVGYENSSRLKITKETSDNLKSLVEDARKEKLNITLISAYRDFSTQQNLFNSYVSSEKARGLSYEEAILEANKYSAREGQSEHHLGTTIDLNCDGCTPFAFSENNKRLYEYLSDNAYKYGFAISYPDIAIEESEYIYEPWHLRYIGLEHAIEYYEKRLADPNFTLKDYLEGICNSK